MSGFAAWSQKATNDPTIWPKPKPAILVTVRLMAAVAGQHIVEIQRGDPDASTALNRTHITFPKPFDDAGTPTKACRDFVVHAVRNAIREDRHMRWIKWMDGSSTAFTPDTLTPVLRPSHNNGP